MPVVANQYNIVVEQGSTFTLSITYKDSEGDPIDLTNFTARMDIRQTYTTEAALVELDSSDGGTGNTSGIALGGLDGTITVVISSSATSGLTAPSTNVYDLELRDTVGAITRILEGKATVSPNATLSTYTG